MAKRRTRGMSVLVMGTMGWAGTACSGDTNAERGDTAGDSPGVERAPREGGERSGPLRAWVPSPRGPRLTPYMIVEGDAITEGDINLGPAERLAPVAPGDEDLPPVMEKGAYNPVGRWPGGVVRFAEATLPFFFSPAHQANILAAMQIWTDATGIRFEPVPGRSPTGDYIAFQSSSECSSPVGRQGGLQPLKLSLACAAGLRVIVHELGHAIGLYHEHTRSDRDDYVRVYPENLPTGAYERDFQPWDDGGRPGFDAPASAACGLPAFNFDSQMLYESHKHTINVWPDMLRIAEATVSGPSSRIYRLPQAGVWTPILSSGISNTNLGYGIFNANAKADLFRSDGGQWFFSADAAAGWTGLRAATEQYRKSRTATGLVLGDFDGNGRTDAMRESGGAWQVSWSATGAWTTLNSDARLGGVVKRPADVTTGDFNGDGKTDILAASGGNYHVRYGGTGSWQLYVDLPSALPDPWLVGYGDFNGDHVTDIFRTNGGSWELLVINPILGASWIAYHTSVPTGALHQTLAHGNWSASIALGDFNGDGLTDVAYTTADRKIRYARTALGAFADPYVDANINIGESLVPLHFNNHNFNFVHTCKTLSSGSFSGQKRCHAGSDIDGDGTTDVLSTQLSLVERGTKPMLSAGDIFAVCHDYAASLTCDTGCPTSVP